MILKGDRVELYRDDAGDINQIISLGKPAHFQQQPQLDQKVTYATGNKLDYTVSSQFLVITDNAKVTQGADSFTGAKINYDMANARVKAFSDSDSNKRVQMVLQPRSDKKK
jgi:lipopolysaccharide export system protein LptA